MSPAEADKGRQTPKRVRRCGGVVMLTTERRAYAPFLNDAVDDDDVGDPRTLRRVVEGENGVLEDRLVDRLQEFRRKVLALAVCATLKRQTQTQHTHIESGE